VLSVFVAKLQQDDIVSRTKTVLSDCLPSGNCTSERVAGALHMSARTLQRKLAAESTTFRKLVEAVRQELAESYLADGSFNITQISYLLGFSSQASFSRSFKRWTGFTPQKFRDTG
jgi:AraC-like DNA-binding protein